MLNTVHTVVHARSQQTVVMLWYNCRVTARMKRCYHTRFKSVCPSFCLCTIEVGSLSLCLHIMEVGSPSVYLCIMEVGCPSVCL